MAYCKARRCHQHYNDIIIWDSRVENLSEMSCFLQDNLLLILAPRSTVTQFRPMPIQRSRSLSQNLPLFENQSYHECIWISSFHLVMWPAASKGNNVLKALTVTNWGQQNKTILLTYCDGSFTEGNE